MIGRWNTFNSAGSLLDTWICLWLKRNWAVDFTTLTSDLQLRKGPCCDHLFVGLDCECGKFWRETTKIDIHVPEWNLMVGRLKFFLGWPSFRAYISFRECIWKEIHQIHLIMLDIHVEIPVCRFRCRMVISVYTYIHVILFVLHNKYHKNIWQMSSWSER